MNELPGAAQASITTLLSGGERTHAGKQLALSCSHVNINLICGDNVLVE
jgi:hypothetical protein